MYEDKTAGSPEDTDDPLLMFDMPEDDKYMGVRMVQKMVDTILYQRAFGVNTLQIIFREKEKEAGK